MLSRASKNQGRERDDRDPIGRGFGSRFLSVYGRCNNNLREGADGKHEDDWPRRHWNACESGGRARHFVGHLFFGRPGLAVANWWFAIAFVVGIAAVVVGWIARTRAGTDSRRLATIGVILGAIPVVWFIGFMILVAIY